MAHGRECECAAEDRDVGPREAQSAPARRRFCWPPMTADVPLMKTARRARRRSACCRTPTLHAADGRGRHRHARSPTKRPAPRTRHWKPSSWLWSSAATSTPSTTTAKPPCTAPPTRIFPKWFMWLAEQGRQDRGLEPQEQVRLDALRQSRGVIGTGISSHRPKRSRCSSE